MHEVTRRASDERLDVVHQLVSEFLLRFVRCPSDRLAERFIKSGALVPVFADRKGMRAHGHHIVFPAAHGKWSKVERFLKWLRGEAVKGSAREPAKTRRK